MIPKRPTILMHLRREPSTRHRDQPSPVESTLQVSALEDVVGPEAVAVVLDEGDDAVV